MVGIATSRMESKVYRFLRGSNALIGGAEGDRGELEFEFRGKA